MIQLYHPRAYAQRTLYPVKGIPAHLISLLHYSQQTGDGSSLDVEQLMDGSQKRCANAFSYKEETELWNAQGNGCNHKNLL